MRRILHPSQWASLWHSILRARHVLFAAFLTVLGIAEAGGVILWVEYRTLQATLSPLREIENLGVAVNNGQAASLLHPIFVHHGDELNVSRLVQTDETVVAGIERVWNTGDPADAIALPVMVERFEPGVTRMTPKVEIPTAMKFYHIYRYEVIAFDFQHAPTVLNDFSVCVLPDAVPAPVGIKPCAAPPAGP